MSTSQAVLVLVIYVAAVARITRLINGDTILDKLRVAIVARQRAARESLREAEDSGAGSATIAHHQKRLTRWGTVNYFVQCPWCVSMWIALASAVIPARLIGWPAWTLVPLALAASHLVGVFAFAADTEEIEVEDVEADES